ncbi:MAG TPA: hypothetical protein VEW95_07645 [Candidatus Limnocylindrales bacterium]|nr:hypothetical protein [Candidatus Limnocylindrales bacterium]
MTVRVVLEVASKRSFASAIDWPGWSRGGRTEDDALEALLAYALRYAAVAKRAKVAFRPPATTRGLDVVQRITGDGGTEFGVPGKPAASENEPVSAADLKRLLALLQASWAVFDAAAKKAIGVELTKGPRGGGRELPKIIEHVREAEVAYLGQLGSRAPTAADEAAAKPMAKLRRTFADAMTAVATGKPIKDPRNTRKPWTPRYTVRRSAWHVLDHAWEIQDRSS